MHWLKQRRRLAAQKSAFRLPLLMGFVIASMTSAAATSQAEPISTTWVFGDSSADVGSSGPSRRPTNQGEMWAESFAKRLGLTSAPARLYSPEAPGSAGAVLNGTNYAENGSQIVSPSRGARTFAEQIDYFAADNRKVNPRDIFFTWFTRNDITNAFFDGVDYDKDAYVEQYINGLRRLRTLGARPIVAFGAEVNLLPVQFLLDRGVPSSFIDQLKQTTERTEAAIWPQYRSAGVYVIDMNRLGNAVIANPAKYGFTQTTEGYQGRGGSPDVSSSAFPNDGNVFTNDGHYTSQMQSVVADYVFAQLRARDQLRQNLLQAAAVFRRQDDIVNDQIADRLAAPESSAGDQGTGSGWRLYATPLAMRNQIPSSGGADVGGSFNVAGLSAGADRMSANGWLVGGRLSWANAYGMFEQSAGKTGFDTVLATVYGGYRWTSSLSSYAVISAGGVSFHDLQRDALLGPSAESAKGKAKGAFTSARFGTAYTTNIAKFSVRVSSEIIHQEVRLDKFSESAGVLALSYGSTSKPFLRGALDVRLSYDDGVSGFVPFIRIGAGREFNNRDLEVKAGPTSNMIVSHSTRRPYREDARFDLGFSYRITPALFVGASAGYSMQFGEAKSASAQELQLNAIWKF